MEAYEQGKCEQVSRAPCLGAVCPGGAGGSWGEIASCRTAWWSLVRKQRCNSCFCLVFTVRGWLMASQTSDFFRSRELLCPLTVRESQQKLRKEFSHLTVSGLGQGRPNFLAGSFSWSHWNGLVFSYFHTERVCSSSSLSICSPACPNDKQISALTLLRALHMGCLAHS